MTTTSGKTEVEEARQLSDIIDAASRQRREDAGCVSLAEAEGFDYPTFFTCTFYYFATGEGQSIGIVMGYAHSAAQLRSVVIDEFGSYYASGAELWPRLHLAADVRSLIPDAIRAVIADPTQVIGNFHYSSRFHLNQS